MFLADAKCIACPDFFASMIKERRFGFAFWFLGELRLSGRMISEPKAKVLRILMFSKE